MKWLILNGMIIASLLVLGTGVGGLAAKAQDNLVVCQNSFAGAVYFDQNLDGVHDGNERYLPGQIEIVDGQGATQQTIQSGDGTFGVQGLACNTYRIHHNRVPVGTVVVGEVMTQDIKMFPKVQVLFFPVVVAR